MAALASGVPDLDRARDRQDKDALGQIAAQFSAAADRNPNDAAAHYKHALARSYQAEVHMELRDKSGAANAAEAGIAAAKKAVELKPSEAEYHRVLGTLCGQVIPANVLMGLKHGRCAQESIDKAVKLNPGSASAWLSRGVGHYYLPAAFGGGTELAIKDIRKALELDPKSAEAWLWLGIALRKANQNAEARKSISKALELNPNRVWAKQQLDKTPPQ
jgi:tetratricopeptide (TPR) repeat protein